WLDLTPGDGFGGRCAGEASPVRRIGCDLDEVVMTPLLNAQNFPQLRLGLQIEIFRAASDKNDHAVTGSVKNNGRCFVHVDQRVKCEHASVQRISRYIHTNRRVAWRGDIERNVPQGGSRES